MIQHSIILKVTLITMILLGMMFCKNKSNERADCQEFEFKNLAIHVDKWRDSFKEPISDKFYNDYIKGIDELKSYKAESFFRICYLSTSNLKGYAVAHLIGPTLDMYFIAESEKNIFLLAQVQAEPTAYLIKKSKLVNEATLEMITIKVDYDGGQVLKDSIFSRYSIQNNVFTKVYLDSIRLTE